MKITVVGIGYVGLSNAILLSQKNEVIILDVDEEKVIKVNQRQSPIVDSHIEFFFKEKMLNLAATTDKLLAYKQSDYVIVATPTNYDSSSNCFDTSSVELVVAEVVSAAPNAVIIIKSTVPVGFTEAIKRKYVGVHIIFSPEFLREGNALLDNLYPSRIVIGSRCDVARQFYDLLIQSIERGDIPVVFTGSSEAEAIKLFSNTYLAMRVAFFNELDSYAQKNDIDTKDIINGVCLDSRIGHYYNNPSFGYGGYCLPKDAKQLLANFELVPSNLIKAVVESNETRKEFIADAVIAKKPSRVGIYRLIMKSGSDNFRESAVLGVMEKIKEEGVDILIYEPSLKEPVFFNSRVVGDIDEFKASCDIIVANRMSDDLLDVKCKVYTRDVFGCD